MPDSEQPTFFKKKRAPAGPPFVFTALQPGDRQDIVDLTTNPAGGFLQINTLELSALGANADVTGVWNASAISNKVYWSDLGSGGRTIRSQITARGYLFPLGHRAIIKSVFQRVIAVDPVNASSDPANYPVAYLQELTTIHVTEPVKTYPAPGQPFPAATGTTDWPFSQVRMITTASPDLDTANLGSNQALWPTTQEGADVEWSFVATDGAARDVAFTMPLLFVFAADSAPDGSAPLSEFGSYGDSLVTAYTSQTTHATYATTGGAPLMFAPESGVSGGTTHPTLLIVLGAATSTADANGADPTIRGPGPAALEAAGQPNFYPTVQSARIRLHAADVLTGGSFHDTRSPGDPLPDVGGIQFRYFPNYVQYGTSNYGPAVPTIARSEIDSPIQGIPSNAGSVYAEAVNAVPLNLPANTVGGICTPNLGVSGLSAAAGAVGGTLSDYAANAAAQLQDYFPTSILSAAQLLGGLNLGDILESTGFNMPTITSQTDPSTGLLTVTYTLNTALSPWPSASAAIFDPETPADGGLPMLRLSAVVTAQPGGGPPTYTVNGSLDPFSIHLLGTDPALDVLDFHFESLTFSASGGNSPTVNVNLDMVNFGGCLQFVNALESFLENLGGSGLSVDVEPTEVTVGLSISLPEIAVGVFSLSGISFALGAQLPFLGGPAVATFAFASQDNPFTLTVSMFGGGGFVSLGAGFGGIQTLQAQFEFCGQFAFDIAVANGSLSLVAGVYFSYTKGDGASLDGFVRATGQLQVLGLITISAELELGLTWESVGGVVQGTATLRAHVAVCGFGKTVPVTMTKTFAGSSAPAASTSPDSDALPAADLTDLVVRRSRRMAKLVGDPQPTVPIGWDDLITASEWTTYCGAFGA